MIYALAAAAVVALYYLNRWMFAPMCPGCGSYDVIPVLTSWEKGVHGFECQKCRQTWNQKEAKRRR